MWEIELTLLVLFAIGGMRQTSLSSPTPNLGASFTQITQWAVESLWLGTQFLFLFQNPLSLQVAWLRISKTPEKRYSACTGNVCRQ